MRNTENGWYQVVIDPDEENFEELTAAARLVAMGDQIKMTPWLAAKFWIGETLHPLIHHYVPMKEWDAGSQRIIATPYETCLWCSRTKEILR